MPALATFHNMQYRCYNKKNINYSSYGAKGVTIYDKWLKNPVSFIKWAEKNGYSEGMQIHRKDTTQGYYPENCVFLSKREHIRIHKTANLAREPLYDLIMEAGKAAERKLLNAIYG